MAAEGGGQQAGESARFGDFQPGGQAAPWLEQATGPVHAQRGGAKGAVVTRR